MKTAAQIKWEALKERGNPTRAEIQAIDDITPWAAVEPAWWLEMMAAYRHSPTNGDPA